MWRVVVNAEAKIMDQILTLGNRKVGGPLTENQAWVV